MLNPGGGSCGLNSCCGGGGGGGGGGDDGDENSEGIVADVCSCLRRVLLLSPLSGLIEPDFIAWAPPRTNVGFIKMLV